MTRAPHPLVEGFLATILDVERRVVVARDVHLRELERALVALGPTRELAAAVLAVLELATFVERELKSPAVSEAIVGATRATLPLLQAAGTAGSEAVARIDEAGARFQRFSSTPLAKTPITAAAPTGNEVRAGPMARFAIADKKPK